MMFEQTAFFYHLSSTNVVYLLKQQEGTAADTVVLGIHAERVQGLLQPFLASDLTQQLLQRLQPNKQAIAKKKKKKTIKCDPFTSPTSLLLTFNFLPFSFLSLLLVLFFFLVVCFASTADLYPVAVEPQGHGCTARRCSSACR